MTIFIGVDVGGTTSTICLGDQSGRVRYLSEQFETRSDEGPQATIDNIADQIAAALKQLDQSLNQVSTITLATPGPATRDGVLMKSPNLIGEAWNRCGIRQMLEDKMRGSSDKIHVKYLGDGQAAALGEYAVRRGTVVIDSSIAVEFGLPSIQPDTDLDSLFMIAVGTGFGGGEVRQGKVVRGRQGRAGHAGHLMLPHDAFRYPHDRQLRVGNSFNSVESAVSLTGLTHQLAYRLTLDQWKDHPLHQVPGTDKDRAKQLRELAADGDALAVQLFEDQAKALGIALLMIQYIGDYDVLIVGGGVCDLSEAARQQYLDIAKQAYFDHALDGFRDFVNIQFSSCGDQASVIGAYQDAREA